MQAVMTWGELLTFLAVFLFIYYGVVLFLFYRKDLLSISGTGRRLPDRAGSLRPFPSSGQSARAADDALFNRVHELMEDCKTVFQAAMQQQLDKEQVLAALRVRVQKYPDLKGTAFQVAITNHIDQEMTTRLGMSLLEQDIESLWRG